MYSIAKTFKFKSKKTWAKVCEALNETSFFYTCYNEKEIVVFGAKACNSIESALLEMKWKYEIVKVEE